MFVRFVYVVNRLLAAAAVLFIPGMLLFEIHDAIVSSDCNYSNTTAFLGLCAAY